MKTQIIQLNPNEDYISVRDKMSWSQAGRILLVWPNEGHALQRKLDLILVSRMAHHQGAQLALITKDTQAQNYARQLGISVFTSPRDAQESHWDDSRQNILFLAAHTRREKLDELRSVIQVKMPTWFDHSTTKIICLTACILAVFGLAVAVIPSASVGLIPKVESQSMVFTVIADPSASVINYSTGSLPSYIQEVTVEGSDLISVTGSVRVADKPATGDLQFTNYSDKEIMIPAGTIVSTVSEDPNRFITTAAGDTMVEAWGSVELPAQAMVPGLAGNVAEDEVVRLEGPLALVLQVSNPEAMSGGSEVAAPAPDVQDMETLHQRLMDRIIQEAAALLHSNLPIGEYLITPSVKSGAILKEKAFPEIGEPGNQLKLTLQVKIQAQVVSAATLQHLVNPVMDAYTPVGYTYVANSLEINPTSEPAILEKGTFSWSIIAQRRLQANIPVDRTIQMLVGRSKAQASRELVAFLPISEPARINISPSWWPRMPIVPLRIYVSTEGIK